MRPSHPRSLFATLAAITVGAAASGPWGCSATEEPAPETAGGLGAAGPSSSATGQGGEPELDAGDKDGPIDEDAACAKSSAEAKLLPLDMVILLDRSGSMAQDNKWVGATAAIETFVNDPASAGIGVGLEFFPYDTDALTCDYKDYDQPLVPIAELPVNAAPIAQTIDANSPGGNTPMWAGLKGTLLYAGGWKDAHPTHVVIVVLASDGQPGSCTGAQNTIPGIATLIQTARAYTGVDTYVIGIAGSDIPSLDQLAAAGGTVKAYDVTADISQFAAKMAEIRLSALGCRFLLPAPPDGQELDIDAVNVDYVPGQGMPELLPQADGLADCGGKPGWYYDDPTHPTEIRLCPASCDVVEADGKAVIKVLFGCTTQLN